MSFKKTILVSVVALNILMLNACTTTLQPEYQPHSSGSPAPVKNVHPLSIQVEDTRAVTPNLVDRVYTTGYVGPAGIPIHSYHDYALNQPVATFIETSLSSALTTNGYRITDQSKDVLQIKVDNVHMKSQMNGMFTNPTLHVEMQAHLALVAKASGKTLWKSSLNVDGAYKPEGMFGSEESVVDGALNNAIDNLANQIEANAELNHLLR